MKAGGKVASPAKSTAAGLVCEIRSWLSQVSGIQATASKFGLDALAVSGLTALAVAACAASMASRPSIAARGRAPRDDVVLLIIDPSPRRAFESLHERHLCDARAPPCPRCVPRWPRPARRPAGGAGSTAWSRPLSAQKVSE